MREEVLGVSVHGQEIRGSIMPSSGLDVQPNERVPEPVWKKKRYSARMQKWNAARTALPSKSLEQTLSQKSD
jgi:hypothetical protein